MFVASCLLVLQGVSWIVIGSLDPFGIYDGMLATSLLGEDQIPEVALPTYRFAIGLLGATDAAFFVLFAFIVKYPFANRERWAHAALAAGLMTWFVLDSVFSMILGAWFNIAIVNVPCLLLLGIPLFATSREFHNHR